jgi:hypothetical protein
LEVEVEVEVGDEGDGDGVDGGVFFFSWHK